MPVKGRRSFFEGDRCALGRTRQFDVDEALCRALEVLWAELDRERPATVVLWTTAIPGQDAALYYGAGPAPYVNIVDDDAMPVPAFGPIIPD